MFKGRSTSTPWPHSGEVKIPKYPSPRRAKQPEREDLVGRSADHGRPPVRATRDGLVPIAGGSIRTAPTRQAGCPSDASLRAPRPERALPFPVVRFLPARRVPALPCRWARRARPLRRLLRAEAAGLPMPPLPMPGQGLPGPPGMPQVGRRDTGGGPTRAARGCPSLIRELRPIRSRAEGGSPPNCTKYSRLGKTNPLKVVVRTARTRAFDLP